MRRERKKTPQKVCSFCVDKIESINYKEIRRLQRYVSERGKFSPAGFLATALNISAK